MPRSSPRDRQQLTDLQQLQNVGPSIAGDLRRIGIAMPQDLCGADPYQLYERLCDVDGQRHDPCVLDVFISIVEFMRGKPAQPWWRYTARRKRELARREREAERRTEGPPATTKRLGRRAFLQGGVLLLAASSLSRPAVAAAAESGAEPVLRLALLTDLHYADRPPNGTRHYRETPRKVAAMAAQLGKTPADLVFELGDLIDSADSLEAEQGYVQTICGHLQAIPGRKHFVLGNHCVSRLTHEEFLAAVKQDAAHYSFDAADFHFIILNACYRSDEQPYGRQNFNWTEAFIPAGEMDWLRADLAKTQLPTLVCVHQRLDVADEYGIKNAPAVRKVLESSHKVLAVLQGHNHKNDYRDVGGIHYVTLQALVEGGGADDNAFACAELFADRRLRLTGFGNQASYQLPT